ncbi:MAG: DUF11 domain-containing protein, partial [Candidatus Magnetomorum sp.]|nr:DUF11 domain-containing protein [Candidatus Magnetomorum sp.]
MRSTKIDFLTCETVDPVEGRIRDIASVEPFGYVFDSITLTPLEGVIVSLHNIDGSEVKDVYGSTISPETSNASGLYQFSNVNPGEGYYIQVIPPQNYRFPSNKQARLMAFQYVVKEASYGRNGFYAQTDTGIFSLGMQPDSLALDIPLDPIIIDANISLIKTSTKTLVFLGQSLSYSLTIHNQSGHILTETRVLDVLPDGFDYIPNTLHRSDLNSIGEPLFETTEIIPEISQPPNFIITIGHMGIDEILVLTYDVQVSATVSEGSQVNTASVQGKLNGATQIVSNIATASVDVAKALYIEKSCTDAIVTIDQPVTYKIYVKNTSGVDLTNAHIWDWLPQGFLYVSGSSHINTANMTDPELQINTDNDIQEMIFTLGDFSKNAEITVTYDLKPGLRALESNRINTARLVADLPDGAMVSSDLADAFVHLQTGPLILEKTTSVKTAPPGEWVPYKIHIKNNTGYALSDVTVFDRLPYGFVYETGSARLADQSRLPVQVNGENLRLLISTLAVDQEISLTYLLRLTPGAMDSDGINAAYVSGINEHNEIKQSTVSRAQVNVQVEGIFSDRGIIFGKIFVDSDENRLQNDDEWPVGGVKLYLEDGTWVITDENGQFSIYGISPGVHVLKIDPLTLPSNVQLMVTDIHQAGDPGSRFVDISPGEFHRADFMLSCPCDHRQTVWSEIKARNEDIRGEWMLEKALEFNGVQTSIQTRTPSDETGDISSGLVYPLSTDKRWRKTAPSDSKGISESNNIPVSTEERIKKYAQDVTREMAHKGAFLFPESDISRDGKFVAVVRAGISPELTVNDHPIPKDRLGEQAFNQQENAQVLAWYGIKLHPGKNRVAVVTQDDFGNHRTLVEKEFYAPGAPENLRIILTSDTLAADGGRSTLPVEIRLEDINQKPAAGIHFITVESDDGFFMEVDIQPNEPGHQVRMENGRVILHLRSAERTGKVTLKAHLDQTLSHQVDIEMITPKRPMLAVGLVDVSLHMNQLSSKAFEPVDPMDEFDEAFYSKNRVALFLKGKIKGDILLTLAYDSQKNDDTTLFRDIDPNAYYPIYGDASVKGFDAQSKSSLYVKLEKGKHQMMWGDYVTDSQQSEHIRLGRFHRTFTGASARYETPRNELTVFAARPYHDHFIEEIPANGTATFYQLQKDRLPIQENSETIEIITRDSDNSGLIIKTRQLKRFDDYLIDAFSGYITFHEAIASRDDNGNRVYLRIGYASDSQTQDYNVAGVRLSQHLSDGLTWGGSLSMDDRPDEGTQLAAGFVAVEPFENHEIVTEFAAQTHENGSPQGQASRIYYTGRWHNNLSTTVSFAQADSGFTNPDASIAAGRQEVKGEVIYTPFSGTEIKTTILESKGIDANDERISASLDVQHQYATLKTSVGFRHTEQTNTADNDTVNSLRLQLENSFSFCGRPGKLYGEIEQDIENSDRKSLKVGGEYFIRNKTKVYAEHELINSLDGISGLSSQVEQSHTKFGVSSQLMGATETYAEHRIRGGMDGREMESVTGLR